MIIKSTAVCGSLPTCTSTGNSRFLCKWFIVIRWFWHISNRGSIGLVIKVIMTNSHVRLLIAGEKGDRLANLACLQMCHQNSHRHWMFWHRWSYLDQPCTFLQGALTFSWMWLWKGARVFHMMRGVPSTSTDCWLQSPATLYIPCSCCSPCGRVSLIPLTLTWYLCIMLAGAEEGETLSLGVTLCQYTASCTVLCFHCCNGLHGSVTPFHRWGIGTSETQMHSPIFQKVFETLASKGDVVISQNLVQWSPLAKTASNWRATIVES